MNKATALIAVAGLLLLAVLWMGYPWTQSQCYRWAAERQGSAAVTTAVGLCAAQFGRLERPL